MAAGLGLMKGKLILHKNFEIVDSTTVFTEDSCSSHIKRIRANYLITYCSRTW